MDCIVAMSSCENINLCPTRAGPGKKRTTFPFASWDLRIGCTDPDITLHMQKKKSMWKILFCFVFRLDLAEISAKTQKAQLFHTKFIQKSSFPINVKFGGYNAEDTKRTWLQVSLPNSPPVKRYYQNSILYITEVISTKNWKNGMSATPRSILRISIWKFNVAFESHVHTNRRSKT